MRAPARQCKSVGARGAHPRQDDLLQRAAAVAHGVADGARPNLARVGHARADDELGRDAAREHQAPLVQRAHLIAAVDQLLARAACSGGTGARPQKPRSSLQNVLLP